MKQYYVYILASKRNGTLYIGITSNLRRRVGQHKKKIADGLSSRHGVDKLMYYEVHDEMIPAIAREKEIEKWNRAWKLELIEKENPEWKDLFFEFVDR